MIKKGARGGARKNAGRKMVLTIHQRLLIGSLCDEFQAKLSERLALDKYEKQPRVQATRKAQKSINEKRLTSERDIRLAFMEAYAGLKKADLHHPATGFVSIPLSRGKTRLQICNMVWTTAPASAA